MVNITHLNDESSRKARTVTKLQASQETKLFTLSSKNSVVPWDILSWPVPLHSPGMSNYIDTTLLHLTPSPVLIYSSRDKDCFDCLVV